MEKLISILKGILKGIFKLILWVILWFVLTLIFIIIAIVLNDGHPVHGSTCSFIASIIVACIISFVSYKKAMKK